MNRWQDYIEERKEVMMGKPVFKGTRLTVQHGLLSVAARTIVVGLPRLSWSIERKGPARRLEPVRAFFA